MEFNWNARNYRQIINENLGYRNQRRPRGVIKKLADRLRCHSTFIAQVLSEKADFSPEQGLEVCLYFDFTPDQQDFFMTLLLHERAGTQTLKDLYRKKIESLQELRRDLKPKNQDKKKVGNLELFESEYFGNWLYQAVHSLIMIPRFQSVTNISRALERTIEEVSAVLVRLELMGLVKKEKSNWKSTLNSLHLAKESPFIRNLHVSWKTKILTDLHRAAVLEGTHYSGIITVTEKDYQKVREILAKAISDIRKVVESSDAENPYVLSLDCFQM